MIQNSVQYAPMLQLREIVERYAALAPKFGEPVQLSGFGLTAQEVEAVFGGLDDDYHISRFLHFSRGEGATFVIGEETVSHVAIEQGIYSIL